MGKGYPPDWNSRRKKVYKRDNYCCQKCGSRGGSRGNAELHAHHKKPKAEGGSHQFSNLTTVCKSCHENIHGHGVGGRSTSSTSTGSYVQELNPEEFRAGVAVLSILVMIVVSGSAIMQVIPQGQSVSQSYEMEYHLLNGPDSTTKYSLNDGPPLYLQKTIDDNVISEGETTPVNVQIINPAGRTLRGQIRINREIGFDNKKTLSTIDYELPPETYKEVNITFKSDSLHDGKTELPTESHITVENEIHSSEYHALYSSQQGVGGDTMTVRKHLFDRFGFKWLILLGLATIAALTWRLRRHLQ